MYVNKKAIVNDLNNMLISDCCGSYVFKTRFERMLIRIKEFAMYNKSDLLLKKCEDIKKEYYVLLNSYDPSNQKSVRGEKAFNINIQKLLDEISNGY